MNNETNTVRSAEVVDCVAGDADRTIKLMSGRAPRCLRTQFAEITPCRLHDSAVMRRSAPSRGGAGKLTTAVAALGWQVSVVRNLGRAADAQRGEYPNQSAVELVHGRFGAAGTAATILRPLAAGAVYGAERRMRPPCKPTDTPNSCPFRKL